MLYDRRWEVVNDNTQRMEVPMGWIVRTYLPGYPYTICFVPDEDKEWVLTEKEKRARHF